MNSPKFERYLAQLRKHEAMKTRPSTRRCGPHHPWILALLAVAGPASADRFSDVIPWTTMPVHAALMPDGNVMTFGATPAGGQGGFDVTVWNPRQGNGPASRVVVPNGFDFNSFCIGGVLNPADGNMLLAGGNSNERVAQFSFGNRTLSQSFTMKYPRYYATTTTLPAGRIHIVGGSPAYGNQGNNSTISEVFTPGKGWTALPNTANGPQRRGNPAATGNPFWYPHVFPVRGTELFVVAGKYQYFENYAGTGGIRNEQAFNGGNYGASSAAVMFRAGLVLQLGGGAEANNAGSQPGSNLASILDLRGVDAQGRTTVKRTDTFMRKGRHWATPTLLANGDVLVTGGSAGNNTLDGVAYDAEIFNPANNQWRPAASLAVPRLYHSTALLLKDGRVWVGGGGAPGPILGNSAEIYTPDYLLNANGVRPSVLTGPTRVALGQTFRITTDRPITRMTLVKTGMATHSFNTDQRFFEAAFKAEAGGYTVTFPNDAVNATPGLYMLFAFDDRGVPSEGKFMRLPSPTGDNGWNFPADTPTNPKLPPSDSATLRWEACAGEGGTCAVPSPRRVRYGANGKYAYREISGSTACGVASFGYDPNVGVSKTCESESASLQADSVVAFEPSTWPGYKVRHANFLGYISPVGSASPDADWAGSRWIARRGRADGACFTFESTDWPGYYLRHQNFRLRMDPPDGSANFNADATYCPRAPLNGRAAGGAVSLESKSWPGYYLQHANFAMYIAPNNGTALFAGDATFLPVNPRKAMAVGASVNLEPAAWPGYRVRHANFMGYISPINTSSSVVDQNGSAWLVRPGLANAACQSFESRDWPGYYLRHQNLRMRMDPRDGAALFDQDATFCPRPANDGRLGGQAVSLESLNYPGHFMLHRNFEMFIAPNDGSPIFRTDSTFVPGTP